MFGAPDKLIMTLNKEPVFTDKIVLAQENGFSNHFVFLSARQICTWLTTQAFRRATNRVQCGSAMLRLKTELRTVWPVLLDTWRHRPDAFLTPPVPPIQEWCSSLVAIARAQMVQLFTIRPHAFKQRASRIAPHTVLAATLPTPGCTIPTSSTTAAV